MKFYLKKLTPQELGYRKGKQSTGAYFYISKYATEFFPHLGSKILNDKATIFIKTKFHDKPGEATYVYHNDKFVRKGGTRNEYRIYLNRDVSPDDFSYRPGDIIVFERASNDSYILYHYKDYNDEYSKLHKIIMASSINGAHALVNNIKFLT